MKNLEPNENFFWRKAFNKIKALIGWRKLMEINESFCGLKSVCHLTTELWLPTIFLLKVENLVKLLIIKYLMKTFVVSHLFQKLNFEQRSSIVKCMQELNKPHYFLILLFFFFIQHVLTKHVNGPRRNTSGASPMTSQNCEKISDLEQKPFVVSLLRWIENVKLS